MPPVMGIAAFVMAELLAMPYAQIALAGADPGAGVLLRALHDRRPARRRHRRIGTLDRRGDRAIPPSCRGCTCFLPPIVLIGLLVAGYSAHDGGDGRDACSLLRRLPSCGGAHPAFDEGRDRHDRRPRPARRREVGDPDRRRSASSSRSRSSRTSRSSSRRQLIAISAAARWSARCSSSSSAASSWAWDCRRSRPTSSARFCSCRRSRSSASTPLAAHFFVMYYCVLSMVTPPVALASYAAAGLAKADADAHRTGSPSHELSFVLS